MPASLRTLLAFGSVVLIPTAASAQFGGGSLRGTSVGVSYNSPSGDFTSLAKPGFGIAIRRGGGGEGETWSMRSSISFDRFAGADSVDNVQMITFGGDIVHQSSRWYQFAGFGLYNTTKTYKSTGAPTSEFLKTRKEQNFGISGGVGATFGSGDVKPFIEVAANLVWGATGNYTWYPVRAGLKF